MSALLAAARPLFAERGYVATSLDDVVARAEVTKGALYHHFASKQALFRAVYEHEQGELMRTVLRASETQRNAWDRLEAACLAFLDASENPELQQITLLDAPAALGWETMRESESEGALRLLRTGLQDAIDEGSLADRSVEPLANLLFGALCEAAMTAARAPDQQASAERTRTEFLGLLRGLRPGGR